MLDNNLIKQFHEGNCMEAYKLFGAHSEKYNGDEGVRFTVYAPHAKSVQVVGDFNQWNGESNYMERYTDQGIWTLFIAGLKQYDIYKYRIETPSGSLVDRADPYAFFSELRPATASKVFDMTGYKWKDKGWMKTRDRNLERNMNIYEVNIGSWMMKKDATETEDGEYYSYDEIIEHLVPYVKEKGFTHIELMPLNEFPFDGSWGYQATGYFAATSRYGNPKQLMNFIDACHENDIGVLMDFVPAHFVKDGHGLHQFDGGWVYEYEDINKRYSEWDSVYFDVTKEEVRSFLMSAVHFWADAFHIDGVRMDAVSNLIYWKGNKFIGANEGAITFLKRMNTMIHKEYPALMLIAEDSTDFPYVCKDPSIGGLGFDYKWDMGWMNDTLRYFKEDPVYRQYDHNLLTFSMMYFYTENFILPFSHDEVVHSKGTILDKMWGSNDQKFAQAKSLYLYMMTHPGKKLNFMGNELGEYKEWDEKKSLGWSVLQYPQHDSFNHFFSDLNHVVKDHPALWQYDYYSEGFRWLVVDDHNQSVFAYARFAPDGDCLIMVMNFIGNTHQSYTVPVPFAGSYKEILNTEKDIYTGSNFINEKALRAKKGKCLNENYSINVKLAPFSAIILEYHGSETIGGKAKATKKTAKKAPAKKAVKAEAKKTAVKAPAKKAVKAETKKTAVIKKEASAKKTEVKKTTKKSAVKKTVKKK